MGCGASRPAPPNLQGTWVSVEANSQTTQGLIKVMYEKTHYSRFQLERGTGYQARHVTPCDNGALLIVQPTGDVQWLCLQSTPGGRRSFTLYNGPVLDWQDDLWIGCCAFCCWGGCCKKGCFHFDVTPVTYGRDDAGESEAFITVNGVALRKHPMEDFRDDAELDAFAVGQS